MEGEGTGRIDLWMCAIGEHVVARMVGISI